MHGIAAVMIVASAFAQARGESAKKPETADAPPAAIVTRRMEFQLPFKTPPVDDQEKAPVEVRLFVSSDAGRNWRTHSRVRPGKGYFQFTAPKDGQYSFIIRTVDRRGALWPKTEPKPEMQVTVDTHPPNIELSAVWNAAGHVTAVWQVTDPTLKPASLKLQYRTSTTEPWQAVAIAPPASEQPSKQSGKATWWPKSTTGAMIVRLEAQDNAGNPAVAQRTLKAASAEVAKANRAAPPARPADDVPPTTKPARDNFAEPAKTAEPAKPHASRDEFSPRRKTETPPVAKKAEPPQPQARRAIPACRIKLTSTQRQHGRLTIRWQTSGASTLHKTIHIAQSNTAQGPWIPVALNGQDDGHHVWQFGRSVPDQVFLMIEVVDRSGARSHYITPEPLWLRPKPSGVPHTGQAPADYRFF